MKYTTILLAAGTLILAGCAKTETTAVENSTEPVVEAPVSGGLADRASTIAFLADDKTVTMEEMAGTYSGNMEFGEVFIKLMKEFMVGMIKGFAEAFGDGEQSQEDLDAEIAEMEAELKEQFEGTIAVQVELRADGTAVMVSPDDDEDEPEEGTWSLSESGNEIIIDTDDDEPGMNQMIEEIKFSISEDKNTLVLDLVDQETEMEIPLTLTMILTRD